MTRAAVTIAALAAMGGAPLAATADPSPDGAAAAGEAEHLAELHQRLSRPFARWRLALLPTAAPSFAPEFYLDAGHVFVRSMAFGGNRFFALDVRRVVSPGWPCHEACRAGFADDPPARVVTYTLSGRRDHTRGFELYRYDVVDDTKAIIWANGKLHALNSNPPRVHAYTREGQVARDEGFHLAGGERYRTYDGSARDNYMPLDFVYVAGRFYVLDGGSNRAAPKVFVYTAAGAHLPEAGFEIDGLRFRDCGAGRGICEFPTHISHADGMLYIKVWLPAADGLRAVTVWRYTLDGNRVDALRLEESARFTMGMTYANGWFYLLSDLVPQRVCAYTLEGARVAPGQPARQNGYC